MEKAKLTRKELYDLVWSVPLSTLSKRYGLTYSRFRTICKKTSIPLPMQGYWMRLKHNKQVEIPDLPVTNPDQESIIPGLTIIEATGPTRVMQIKFDIEESCREVLRVPPRLTNPDILIVQAREAFENAKIESWGKDKGYISPFQHKLPIFVTPKYIKRSLRILDAFIKLIRARGHSVSLGARLGHVEIGNQSYAFNLREKQKRIPSKDRGYEYGYEPTGILILYAGEWYDKKAYIDGREPLEKKLSSVLADLEYRHEYINKIWAENDARKKIEEEKERVILLARKKEQLEKEKFQKLLRDANRWHQAKIMREFIIAVEVKAHDLTNVFENKHEWIAWAKNKIELYDPLGRDLTTYNYL